jgi:hypothetical protein
VQILRAAVLTEPVDVLDGWTWPATSPERYLTAYWLHELLRVFDVTNFVSTSSHAWPLANG